MVHKLGLNKENVYDDLKAAVVAAPQFRWNLQDANVVLVQTSFCEEVGFGIWLKHHGNIFQ